MSKASAEEILAWALEQEAIVVTLDADFHAILAVSGAAGPSVIRMRRQGPDAIAVAELCENVLAGYEPDLTRGGLVTVKLSKTTCHKLPIGEPDSLL
jgi:predicted nuclease of predicted toxin-antitoxin system